MRTLLVLQLKAGVLRTPAPELAAWLVEQLQGLGPTYVKIGQFISTRHDIFGDAFSAPFAELRDRVTPIRDEELRAILAANLDLRLFERIDYTPVASASIGQVHRAVLAGSRAQVVLKVKRPGVEAVIREDVAFLRGLIGVLRSLRYERNIEQAQSGMDDLERYLTQEVDFRREVEHMARFHDMYAPGSAGADPRVRVPRVYRRLCSDAVIVMEFVESRRITAYAGRDRRAMALRLMDVFVSQLVHRGWLHGDPHPGNLGVDRQGRIVLYDFGSVVRITPVERHRMKELIYQLMLGNNAAVVRTLAKLGVKVLDEPALSKYVDLYREYMRTIDVAVLAKTHDPAAALPLQLNDKIARIIRVYGTLEGICKQIYGKFNYFELLDTYVDELFLDEAFVAFKASEDLAAVARDAGAHLASLLPSPRRADSPGGKREGGGTTTAKKKKGAAAAAAADAAAAAAEEEAEDHGRSDDDAAVIRASPGPWPLAAPSTSGQQPQPQQPMLLALQNALLLAMLLASHVGGLPPLL
jgi:ubiquinone biosynthesis protein